MEDPIRQVMVALRDVTAGIQQRVAHALDDEGLGMPHMLALRQITLQGPCTVSSLARSAGITKGAMSPVVQRLVDAGMARRRQDEGDRRIHWIEPTDKAATTKARLESHMGALLDQTLHDWDDARRAHFAAELEILRQRLTES